MVHCDTFLKYHLQELKKKFSYLDKEISLLQRRVVELPAPFYVDFKIGDLLKDYSVANNHSAGEQNQFTFSILDASSAAAAYFNLKGENDLYKMMEVREALMIYGEKSTLNMASLITNILPKT